MSHDTSCDTSCDTTRDTTRDTTCDSTSIGTGATENNISADGNHFNSQEKDSRRDDFEARLSNIVTAGTSVGGA
jgi:hypothetical protein